MSTLPRTLKNQNVCIALMLNWPFPVAIYCFGWPHTFWGICFYHCVPVHVQNSNSLQKKKELICSHTPAVVKSLDCAVMSMPKKLGHLSFKKLGNRNLPVARSGSCHNIFTKIDQKMKVIIFCVWSQLCKGIWRSEFYIPYSINQSLWVFVYALLSV